jgi:FMN phosphatase YigB (HAD superfamily)
MTLTLLFDLDDTLLENNIDTFIPAYLKKLAVHLANYVAPDLMVSKLLAATQVMLANNTAENSLERVFDQAFYPAIGRGKEEMRPILEQFYSEVFPELQGLTRPIPQATHVVQYARSRGHTIAIATNPLFPRMAIHQRLRWAGFDPEQAPFSLITSYESFHFAKPNSAFITEILAQLGWADQPAVMIGNSLADDLSPAAQLGLPVFWVTDQVVSLPEGFHPLSSSGTLSDVPAWLDRVDSTELRQEYFTPAALLAILKSTPAALDTLSQGLVERQWQERPDTGEWSLTEIFSHLRDVDREVNIPRFSKIIAGENPFVPGINTDTWAEERDYFHNDGPSALRGFIETRSQMCKQLERLSDEEWQRPARHAIFGPTHLGELVSFVATHDCSHIQQSQAAARSLSVSPNPSEAASL